ncbi:DUF1707 domain-containing protein [Streptomyces marincola]|nr:DUF1707 domain-containing protein [Streptomyces marincola]UCM89945.1 DUF1707 domain-containing protein [Streptomyces marincola]
MTMEPRPRAEMRASHEDREAVAERLREAAGEGRLDIDELEERLERALTAKTYGELEPLLADLPALPGRHAALGPAPAVPEGPPLVLKGGLHGDERVGRWRVPRKVVAHGGLGGVKLDYTRADCPWPEPEVEVHGDMAGITIVVPLGWEVDTTGADSGFGGVKNKTGAEERRPGAPLLRVTGTGGVAGVTIRHPNLWERRRLRDNPPPS